MTGSGRGQNSESPPHRKAELARRAKEEAATLGFSLCGICGPEPSEHADFYAWWLERGYHGGMRYLSRDDAVARRRDLRGTMPDVRSIVVVADDYFLDDSPGLPGDGSRGVFARYARGRDYHDHMKGRLKELLRRIQDSEPGGREIRGFPYVDTGPILERELARRAGLGWFGRNTLLIHPRRGSYFFLGVLLLDIELPPDPPFDLERCGTCRACLDACPTEALLGLDDSGAPVLDARRCISYLTIESKGPIPEKLRSAVGNRVFGCDICQEVCPWNHRFAPATSDPAYQASGWTDGPYLLDLLDLDRDEFAVAFSGSPVKRAKRAGLLGSVAVALGNWLEAGTDVPEGAASALARAVLDEEPLIRGHSAWAMGRLLSRTDLDPGQAFVGNQALVDRLEVEEDPWVRAELKAALASIHGEVPPPLGESS
jgi:epoxyqueuosine reductase